MAAFDPTKPSGHRAADPESSHSPAQVDSGSAPFWGRPENDSFPDRFRGGQYQGIACPGIASANEPKLTLQLHLES
jgi:hypothetical protein